ncbi:Tim44-like domain-containing protein [Cryptosporidium muris RN66]|uniref:Tim44-like domain-containing protein n=1 Tax=Cryptosporidium muris (strain RN66) TaxID=441375 RepID=B6AG36_CRYMR|nr:Tim44-like domain-containing protein [Cryptosporidium muris RN66]EEA07177.1 Tim44-like domain-containing protein [Cryptosporidium muris RN66]|eukprot:XP_002141526.1 Tim44-like domain-containing protein [Cryptosporidium muris RN66]
MKTLEYYSVVLYHYCNIKPFSKYCWIICKRFHIYKPYFTNNTVLPSLNYKHKLYTIRKVSGNSFINQVMEQVKKEIEANPELRRHIDELKTSTQRNSDDIFLKISNISKDLGMKAEVFYRNVKDGILNYSDKFPMITSFGRYINNIAFKLSDKFIFGVKYIGNMLHDDTVKRRAQEKLEIWRKANSQNIKMNVMDEKIYNSEDSIYSGNINSLNNIKSSSNLVESDQKEKLAEQFVSSEYALVLSHDSVWDRFGARLRDMPLLINFFENPIIEKLFGETEFALAIKEMRKVDPTFNTVEFIETVETVIIPHIIDAYLVGNDDVLRLHCGITAYAALSASCKERRSMKLKLDPTLLLIRNVDLKGAKRWNVNSNDSNEYNNFNSYPWFIFTFSTQQINCLRDYEGKVVSGSVDDIREVVYSMAITRHPNPSIKGLEYPYLISEIAIIGSSKSW